MSQPVRYILICPARTGSSALVSYLQSHPNICSHPEVFGVHTVEFYGVMGRLKPPIIDWLTELRRRDPIRFLNEFVFYAGKRKAVGFKFKFEELSLSQFEEATDYLRRNTDIKIIFLTRKNLLKRYVSQYLAVHVNKKYNFHKGEALPPTERIRLEASECASDFVFTSRRQATYRAFFSEHPLLEVTYEDLVDAHDETLTRIQDFLGVEPLALETKLVKIQQQPLSAVIENFEELRAYFVDTDYAVFFDDTVR